MKTIHERFLELTPLTLNSKKIYYLHRLGILREGGYKFSDNDEWRDLVASLQLLFDYSKMKTIPVEHVFNLIDQLDNYFDKKALEVEPLKHDTTVSSEFIIPIAKTPLHNSI